MADSDLGRWMTTRSSVDKNTVLVSGLPVKARAKPIVVCNTCHRRRRISYITFSSDIPDPSPSVTGVTEDDQAIFNMDSVASKQKVRLGSPL